MISVVLPISRLDPGLGDALDSILEQSVADLDIMLVLNGADAGVRAGAMDLAGCDRRVRVIEIERASLPAALNLALAEARFDLVARMDDDDWSHPDRLAVQAAAMEGDAALAAVGCAWEIEEPGGSIAMTVRPPTDPAELRWRLLLGNCLAHGSMMLRRSAVLDAGGYDESLDRAQDLELWLRLGQRGPRSVGAVGEVLYRHRVRETGGAMASSSQQAIAAAGVLVRAWSMLPEHNERGLVEPLAGALRGIGCDDSMSTDPVGAIERVLTERGATRVGLIAKMLADRLVPNAGEQAIEACRRSRLREVGARLRAQGASVVTLWGAGNRGRWIAHHRDDLGLEIEGFVDDCDWMGEVEGLVVASPTDLRAGQWVLIASDLYEDAIWQHSAPLRARGVRVVRLYQDSED